MQAPPVGGPGTPAPPMAWDPHYYAWTSGPQPGPGKSRRWALIAGGVGGALLLALIAVIVVRASAMPPATPRDVTTQESLYDLAAGDCLAGSNMALGDSTKPWPDLVTVVACTQPHEAEVYFAGDLWPQSAAYPGKDAIDNQTFTRCNNTFTAYDGIKASIEGNDPPGSAFTFIYVAGDSSADWTSGERHLVCVAYKPDFTNLKTGATPVNYSIKGTKK